MRLCSFRNLSELIWSGSRTILQIVSNDLQSRSASRKKCKPLFNFYEGCQISALKYIKKGYKNIMDGKI